MIPEPAAIAAIVAAFLLAGVAKGATGAGAPVVAVPVMAAFTDVRLAVVVMVMPNIVTNALQMVRLRAELPSGGFALAFAGAGAAGAVTGTSLLVTLPERTLSLLLAAAVIAYVVLRVTSELRLSSRAARWLVVPCGLGGGLLQGASGISAPFSVSFVNAMRLPRTAFIALISSYFLAITLVQFVALVFAGLYSVEAFALSLAACLPLLATMPAGAWLAAKLPEEAFDKIILALLVGLAIRLVWSALS